jgi:uncharacterized Zn finger protein (UPF0148 family)
MQPFAKIFSREKGIPESRAYRISARIHSIAEAAKTLPPECSVCKSTDLKVLEVHEGEIYCANCLKVIIDPNAKLTEDFYNEFYGGFKTFE